MRIIPVLDLKGGQVVHAVGGRRDEYRPIRSRLVDSSIPAVVAQTMRDRLGLHEMYVADLDAIAGSTPAWETLRRLAEQGFDLKVDIGVRSPSSATALLATGVRGVVVGLETIQGLESLRQVTSEIGGQSVWFSLDLKNGEPLAAVDGWRHKTPQRIAGDVVAMGIRQLIVLDLARVGEGRGIGTEAICEELLKSHPGIELIVGGGIRDRTDLKRLEQLGVSGALVATALHSLALP